VSGGVYSPVGSRDQVANSAANRLDKFSTCSVFNYFSTTSAVNYGEFNTDHRRDATRQLSRVGGMSALMNR